MGTLNNGMSLKNLPRSTSRPRKAEVLLIAVAIDHLSRRNQAP